MDPKCGPRGVQVGWSRGQKPVFQLLNELLVLFGLFHCGKPFEIGVGHQFCGQRTVGAQKEQGGFLQSRLALGRHQARPPFLAGEILARKAETLEVILQQQPGSLGIHAGGEVLQPFRAFGDRRLGVGQFAPQVGERAVGLLQYDVVGIVLGGGDGPLSVSVFA